MLNHNESFTYQPSSTDNWTETTDFMEQTRLGLLDANGLSGLRVKGVKVGSRLMSRGI